MCTYRSSAFVSIRQHTSQHTSAYVTSRSSAASRRLCIITSIRCLLPSPSYPPNTRAPFLR